MDAVQRTSLTRLLLLLLLLLLSCCCCRRRCRCCCGLWCVCGGGRRRRRYVLCCAVLNELSQRSEFSLHYKNKPRPSLYVRANNPSLAKRFFSFSFNPSARRAYSYLPSVTQVAVTTGGKGGNQKVGLAPWGLNLISVCWFLVRYTPAGGAEAQASLMHEPSHGPSQQTTGSGTCRRPCRRPCRCPYRRRRCCC